MIWLMRVINYLFVPCLSFLILIYRRRKEHMRGILIYAWYGASVVINFILSGIAVRLLNRVFYLPFAEDSIRYTVLSAVIALVWPYVLEFFQKALPIHLDIESRSPQK